MSPEHLTAWMQRPEWLRGAAAVRAEEAEQHPPHSDERRRNAARAAELERLALAAGSIA